MSAETYRDAKPGNQVTFRLDLSAYGTGSVHKSEPLTGTVTERLSLRGKVTLYVAAAAGSYRLEEGVDDLLTVKVG